MRLRNVRDLLAGCLFLAFGLAFLYFAQDYQLGSARRMGPAYFPVVLSLILIGIGLATVGRALRRCRPADPRCCRQGAGAGDGGCRALRPHGAGRGPRHRRGRARAGLGRGQPQLSPAADACAGGWRWRPSASWCSSPAWGCPSRRSGPGCGAEAAWTSSPTSPPALPPRCQPLNLLYCFLGVLLGTLVGVLPGLGPVATIAMLLPVTFALPPESALIMLAGIYYGAQYGGSTTAILINLPGESSSVVTALDGYHMAQQGRAGAALATAAIGSFFAGTVATFVIAFLAPPLSAVALQVPGAGVFLADGAGPRRLDRAGAGLAHQGAGHGRAGPAARAGRHRRHLGHGALHLRRARACRRHQLRRRRHGRVRRRRDRAQSRERAHAAGLRRRASAA